MDVSDGMDKSWDHPWSTEEMKKHRREWSLAGDAGLLKYLQQFTDNLFARTKKTEEALDALTTRLKETAILLDNVTNTSLALANTQFIESRVQEDDIEIEKKTEDSVEETKSQDSLTADLIATVSESVREGLNLMDEKYRQMEVVDSDSEDEDHAIVLSVILGPNNPYQDRPLPYVIGSEKWINSTKIGLESSSSESEQIDDEDESDTDKERTPSHGVFNANAPKTQIGRLSSSSSESDHFNQRNNISYMNNAKIDTISQTNMNSHSESITPVDSVPKAPLPSNPTPNFAEELAKRLGTVRQDQKPPAVDAKSEASINRYKDDLFSPEEDDAFNNKSRNIFSESKPPFADETSIDLWNDKHIKTYKNNIIPASIDVPPPISTVSTKPKSAIDDLFADAESDDSDDIFSSKSTIKKITKDNNTKNATQPKTAENIKKKYLDTAVPGNMATSTPETDVKATSLFSDEEDDSDLFGSAKGKPFKSQDVLSSSKKKPIGEPSILRNILASDIENKVSNKLLRAQSSGSSGSDTPANYENERTTESLRNAGLNDNIGSRSPIVAARNNAENLAGTIESSSSSGISIHPSSINNTGGSSIGVDFQPQMTSTRLRSEEIYRERIGSDSLFAARTRNPVSEASNSANNQPRDEPTEDGSSAKQDDVFDNEDLFSPPPLPKPSSRPAKSKISSLFDDSDSGDELFSATSSGSRSLRSTDFLATTPQHAEKAKATQRRGLFDDEIDIFASKDSPDVDIFGIAPKPTAKETPVPSSGRKLPEIDDLFGGAVRESGKEGTAEKVQTKKPTTKRLSLFDDDGEDDDDTDLFGGKPIRTEFKADTTSLFKNEDEDEDDLFSLTKPMNKQQSVGTTRPSVQKEERSVEPGSFGTNDAVVAAKTERKTSDILSGNGLFSSAISTHGLVFEDDDYDDLFASKSASKKEERKAVPEKTLSTVQDFGKAERMPAEGREKTSDSANVAPELKLFGADEKTIETIVPEEKDSGGIDARKEEAIAAEGRVSAEGKETENGLKKSPPKTLNIRAAVSPPPTEDNSQGPRRTVSGKIKNLMGKMGDLKILSPMDTPPLWRKSEEKTDEEAEVADRDSDDGGCVSTEGQGSPASTSESNAQRKQTLRSAASGGSNAETAISFDEPVQVETLPTAASRTRVRIQAKRRPQSRHARKSALRQSGIDFDTVDATEGTSQEENRATEVSDTFNKEITDTMQINFAQADTSSSDRIGSSTSENLPKTTDASLSLATDDKSELGSLSKENSLSANKNTLLSPSTDEEDLFDVPPDLPEDSQKEDTLFGRAPILSPVDRLLSEKIHPSDFKPLRDTVIRNTDNVETIVQTTVVPQSDRATAQGNLDDFGVTVTQQTMLERKIKQGAESKTHEDVASEPGNEVIDPLRDDSHDPLKDPSQLFAFVTKTPSPEKGKSLLFAEDDSLFSSGPKIQREDRVPKKQILDLFADEAEGDLFSTSLVKPVKKPLKDTKISLFDDDDQDDDDDSLFGSVKKKSPPKVEPQKSSAVQPTRKKSSLFDDDDSDNSLFSEHFDHSQKHGSTAAVEAPSKTESFGGAAETIKASSIRDIFGNQSSGEEDIFAAKPIVPKKVAATKSLFPSDDENDDGEIFGKPGPAVETKVKSMENRPVAKKPVTRDLKKTAKQIGQDPLSILQDD